MSTEKVMELEFGSLSEMMAFIDNNGRCKGMGEQSSDENHSPRESWDLGLGVEGAKDIARNGGNWSEGAAKICSGITEAAALRQNAPAPMFENSVAGFMPDVPAYLAGVPDDMVAYAPGELSQASSPIFKIGFTGFSAGTQGPQLMNKGIAILTLTDVLEAAGYRVQIDWTCTVPQTGQTWSMVIKQASEHWSPDSMAFSIAHPAFFRRIWFLLAERTEGFQHQSNMGYGTCASPKGYDINLPYQGPGDLEWRTLESSLDAMQALAAAAGTDVELRSTK